MDWSSLGWPALICAIVLTQLFALYCVYLFVANLRPWYGKPIPCSRCLIVTAHPDDESMFFGPFIVAEIEQNSEVHLLCFSNGGFYGNGEKRSKELQRAAEKLGIFSNQVTLLDWPHFPDNPKVVWKASDVREVILDYCSGKPQIDAIVTFDSYGVSGHLNHIAIYNAVRSLIGDPQFTQRIFVLESVSIFRKYCRPIDEIFAILRPSPYRYRASERQAAKVQSAMRAHESQLMWFRDLYRLLSRYMIVNTFVEIGGRRRERRRSRRERSRSEKYSTPPQKKSSSPPKRSDSEPESDSSSKSPPAASKDSPQPSAKDSPQPSAKDSPQTSDKDSPQPSAKDSPQSSDKDSPQTPVKSPRPPSKEIPRTPFRDPQLPTKKPRLYPKGGPQPPGKTAYFVGRSDDFPGKSSLSADGKKAPPKRSDVPFNRSLPKKPVRSHGKYDRLSRSPPGKTACPISRPKFDRSPSKVSKSGKGSPGKGNRPRGRP